MSKITKKIIDYTGCQCTYENGTLTIKYNNKIATLDIPQRINITLENNLIKTTCEVKQDEAICGTINRLIYNKICGLKTPFMKFLKLEGTGYRGSIDKNVISFSVGLSHKVEVIVPDGIQVVFKTPTQIELSSIDKEFVSMFAQKLISIRPHDIYSGKGILEVGVVYRRKETKRK